MMPNVCENCGARAFIEQDGAYVCTYCDSRCANHAAIAEQEVHFNDTFAPEPEYKVAEAEPVYSGVQTGRRKNKWIALILWFFFGVYGGHKFYEGKIIMGLVYFFTAGLFGIGWIVDLFILVSKPNPYYV